MCRLDAGRSHRVVNKGCRLSPSTSLSSSWLLLAYIAPVVGIYRTRRLGHLSLVYIALAVRIDRTHLLSIRCDALLLSLACYYLRTLLSYHPIIFILFYFIFVGEGREMHHAP